MKSERRGGMWAIAATLAVAAALIAAFLQLGSPAERRRLRLDEERVDRLQKLRGDIETYLQEERSLPSELSALAAQPWAAGVPNDPVSHRPFAYEVIAPRRYRLCAEFERPSRHARGDRQADFWAHPKGRHCYEIDVEAKAAPSSS